MKDQRARPTSAAPTRAALYACFIAAVYEPYKHDARSTITREPLNGKRSSPLDRCLFGSVGPEILEKRLWVVADVGERHLCGELAVFRRARSAVDVIAAHREQTMHLSQTMKRTEAIVALPGFMSLTARRARASVLD
ncbi:hypothetical protein PhiBTCVTUL1a_34 [Burkholderia phage phiBtTUL1a]|nr:hypothetical protein PhiBTCVTUL1a_34 [Burkholderia phage phiBtTUL1a]